MRRALRLKKDFENLKSHGKIIVRSPELLVIARANEEGHLRWGFSVSRKVGSAVVRNRYRRQFRALLTQFIEVHGERSFDIHFIPRNIPAEQAFLTYKELQGRVLPALAKLPAKPHT